jgi:anhydro-N-acetylmuramic acid kinase
MRVLGLMSGTSADGMDVALVRVAGRPPALRARLERFATIPYPARVRAAILRLANGAAASAAEVSQLHFLLGEQFASAALAACRRFGISPRAVDLIGSHGQTVFHQGRASRFLGARVASTLQLGEPAVIAARTGITTIADFRPADMAAGGQGAPLVPFVDYLLYRDARRGRVALNIGGIANVTVIPAAARPAEVIAFDTGPGNMVVDALVRHLSRGRLGYDRDARLARRGVLLPPLLERLLADPYFRLPPPKTAGREQFGERFAAGILAWGRRRRARAEDLVRAATLLAPLSILDALHRWVLPRVRVAQLVVSGGGAHNPLMMAQLAAGLVGIEVIPSGAFGVPEDAKEAFAFAVLAYETFHGRPANLPGSTGARGAAILGKVSYAPR